MDFTKATKGNSMTGLILAIDPSLTNTACVIGDGTDYAVRCFASRPLGPLVFDRINRYLGVTSVIDSWIGGRGVSRVFIEGYSFGSKGAAVTQIAEYGGMLRHMLLSHTSRIYEVAPSTLKKFCTGKGAGPKDMIAAHIASRYKVMLNNNDEFDAYGLYRLGLVAEGLEEAHNQAQRECVDKVLGRSVTKKPKAKGA